MWPHAPTVDESGHAGGAGATVPHRWSWPVPVARNKLGVRLLTAFVIGFVTLTLEIAYTRVISFKLFYYYTYFVIGVALLGLGAASAVTALSSRLRAVDTARLVRVVAPLAALVGAAAATSSSPACRPTST